MRQSRSRVVDDGERIVVFQDSGATTDEQREVRSQEGAGKEESVLC